MPYTKNNSRWIKDLNTRTKTIKLLEENKGGKHHDIEFIIDFLHMTLKAQGTKEKTDKLDYIEMRNICYQRVFNRVKSQPIEWKKKFK